MGYLVYPISPLEHAMATDRPSLFTQQGFSPWAFNGRIDKNCFMKRWGYSQYRNLGSNVQVLAISPFQISSGNAYTLFLTDTDLCKLETASGKTFRYLTNTGDYNASVKDILTPFTTVNFKASTIADTEDIAVGDKFVLDTDDLTADEEPDSNWATISGIHTAGGYFDYITLDTAYPGTHGDFNGSEKNCIIRRVYSTPSNERWQFAIVNDRFCFTNGSTNVQSWNGTGYASALNSTYATKSKYCIEYANRLWLGNLYVSTVLSPFTIKSSKEGDPTNWTDSTAVEIDLLDTEDYISGMAKVGAYLVVFKPDSYSMWYRTGIATDPIRRGSWRIGVGCAAPYSIVQFENTVAWLSRNDFYIMNGETPEPIGEKIRHLFFDLVSEEEIKNVWGGANFLEYEIMWVANTTDYGKLAFVWNWKHQEWYMYQFAGDILCLGRGIA